VVLIMCTKKKKTFLKLSVMLLFFYQFMFHSNIVYADTNNNQFSNQSINTSFQQAFKYKTGTMVNGHISVDSTWSPEKGPYIVTGNLIIDSEITLNILPGTTVMIYPGVKIIINGTVNALSYEEDNIVFTSLCDQNNPCGYWGEINIAQTGCFNGYGVHIRYGNKLFVVNGRLNLTSCFVSNAGFTGIIIEKTGEFNGLDTDISKCCVESYCYPGIPPNSEPCGCKGIIVNGTLNLTNSNIHDCPGTGILVKNTGNAFCVNLKINLCQFGVYTTGYICMLQSTISNCQYGIYSNSTQQILFNGCNIKNNSILGCFNANSKTNIDLTNNYWGSQNGPSVLNPKTGIWSNTGGDKIIGLILYNPWSENEQS
jgi:hypothetical protein